MISIIFKSLCEEVMAMFVLKVVARKFNNKGSKVKAMESLIKQSTIPKAGAFITSLKLLPLMISATLAAMIIAN